MNILVCNNFVRQGSGTDASVMLQVRALRQQGHRVRIFAADNALFDRSSRVTRARYLASTLYSFAARRSLKRLLSAESFDVAYVHNTVPLLTGSIYDALRQHGIVTIQHLHNYRAFCLSSYAYRDDAPCDECVHTAFAACARHRCYRDSFPASAILTAARLVDCARGRRSGYGAQAYIANSEFTKREHVRHGIPDESIWVLHNASADVAELLPVRATPPGARRKSFTFVGSLLRAKGVYLALDLAEAMPDWEVQLIGAGPEEAGLRRQLAARRLGNVALRGLLKGSAKASAWNESFATIVPSVWDEPFGLVVPESYSLSIPVIATGAGGVAELIRHGETGLVETFRSPAMTASMLRALWQDESRYVAMRQAARGLFEAEFAERIFADRLVVVQMAILARH